MKVLHLWDSYSPGLFDRSFEICISAGIETRLVCMHFLDRRRSPCTGISYVRRIKGESGGATIAKRIWRKQRLLLDRNRFRHLVRQTVRRFNPDIIHIHYGTTAAILEREAGVLERAFVISFYGFDISQGVRTPAIREAYRRLMGYQPLVHVLCDEAAERALELGARRDRIVDANLPLAVDLYPYVGVAGNGAFRWLMPARFVEKKGHGIALQAFRRHLEVQPESHLTCWGYGDSRWLRKLTAELGLADRVDIIDNSAEGSFDEAYLGRLKEHDAVLAPSVRSSRGDDEGGPALTAVLAQLAGKPVIVSDFPGHERSVTDTVEGLVVHQADVAALTAAMNDLSSDRDRAREMGRAGRDRANREFSEKFYEDALINWYRTLAR